MRPQLAKITDDLAHGRSVPPVTTREFLSWFHAQRRGYWIVRTIREELQEAQLQTVPDFESAWIDAPIELRRALGPSAQPEPVPPAPPASQAAEVNADAIKPITTLVGKDPTYRLSKLNAANQSVISVK